LNKYGWDAKGYASNSQNQYTWAKELISKLPLASDESILDIGCGDGKISAEIAQTVPKGRVVGIDSSPNMINLAKRNFPQQRFPNLSFELMNAQQLVFDQEFDVAFSNAALHWVMDQKSVLAGVYRSLRSGGKALFQMGGKGSSQPVIDIFDELKTNSKYQSFFSDFKFPYNFPTPQEYIPLLIQAHLEPLRVELFVKDMNFLDLQGMAGWIRTTWLPFTERVPAALREGFIREISEGYLRSHPTQTDGRIHVEMVRLEVEAKKS
jgi:trans-aconitate methyltransferase